MTEQGTQEPMVPEEGGPEISSNDKTIAALAYIFPVIVSAIVLLSETNKARPFQRFHAVQSLGLAAVYIVWEIVVGIVTTIIGAVSGGLLCCIGWILPLLPIVPALYYAYQSYQGQTFEVPWLTQFMRQQGWL